MSPQPRHKAQDDEPVTAEDVASERKTEKPPEDADDAFEIERLRREGDVILGNGFSLPDVRAAFAGLPPTRKITVADARDRVKEWLGAPVQTHETPAATEPV